MSFDNGLSVGQHADGSPDYTVSVSDWPSQFIMKKVREALDEHDANWRISHKRTTDNLLLGILYQDEVLLKFLSGTEYVAVQLGRTETEEIEFKVETHQLFSSPSRIDAVIPSYA